MASSTEQTENVRSMFEFLRTQANIAVTNNVAHATATSNAWRDAVDMIPRSTGSLSTLLLQLGDKAGPIVTKVGGVNTVNTALDSLQNMKLVFDSQSRQMILKKAVKALTDLKETLTKLPGAGTGGEWGSGAPAASASSSSAGAGAGGAKAAAPYSSAGLTGMALLNSPMPHIEKAKVVFDPANMRTGPSANPEDAAAGISRNIKPVNKMTFSSAEGSASARLGMAGKCATCGAHRDVGTNFCPQCGKNSNIIFE